MTPSTKIKITRVVLYAAIVVSVLYAVSHLFAGSLSIYSAINLLLIIPTIAVLRGSQERLFRILSAIYGVYLVGMGLWIFGLALSIGFWVMALLGIPVVIVELLVFQYLRLTATAPTNLVA